MYKILMVLISLMIACLTKAAGAQSAEPALIEEAAVESEWQKIRPLAGIYEQAVSNGNLDLLAPHLDDAFTGVTVTGIPVRSLDGLKEYYRRMKETIGATGTISSEVSFEQPGFMRGDIAVTRGITRDVVTTDTGKVFPYTSQWTVVLSKVGDSWKILRLHASMDPVDNSFASFFRNQSSRYYGIIGFILGAVLGSGFMIVRGRYRER